MEPIVTVLGGITVAVISSAITKSVSDYKKVSDDRCRERREGCSAHVCSEMARMRKDQEEMKKDIKELLGRVGERNNNS